MEVCNSGSEMYGADRLKAFIAESADLSADEFSDSLLAEIRSWSGHRSDDFQDDDLTLVVVDVHEEGRQPTSRT